jgi:IS1 family transposase
LHEPHDASEEFGDVYTFVGIDRTSKLVLAWHCGKRDLDATLEFSVRLSSATGGRFQLTTDGLNLYRMAIPPVLGGRVDFAQLIKTYGKSTEEDRRKYSPPSIIACEMTNVLGNPDITKVCTSYVERQNLSMRMGIRRFTRLTNAHSKKWENHECAVALWFAYYNFCRVHMTLKTTPAVKARITDHVWTIEELLTAAAAA